MFPSALPQQKRRGQPALGVDSPEYRLHLHYASSNRTDNKAAKKTRQMATVNRGAANAGAAIPATRRTAEPATAKQRGSKFKKRDWDNSLTDLSVYQLTPMERQRRKEWYRPRSSGSFGGRHALSACRMYHGKGEIEDDSTSKSLLTSYFDAQDFTEFLRDYAPRKARSTIGTALSKHTGGTGPLFTEALKRKQLETCRQKPFSVKSRPARSAPVRSRQTEMEPEHPRPPISNLQEREVDVDREIALFERKRRQRKKAMNYLAREAEPPRLRTRAAKTGHVEAGVTEADELASECSGSYDLIENSLPPFEPPSHGDFSREPFRGLNYEFSKLREATSPTREDNNRTSPVPTASQESEDPLRFLNECARSLTSLTTYITQTLAEFRNELNVERTERWKLEEAAQRTAVEVHDLLRRVQDAKREQEILSEKIIRLESADSQRRVRDRRRKVSEQNLAVNSPSDISKAPNIDATCQSTCVGELTK